ncbi:phage capsid scaffolding protein [Stenotrophomonas acidaminiphila]|uniref:Phage capsid scaffolding protein n=1 Tax=Stenotrophomonas acidaminiphila TaxID=128780 RepID=A0A0S1B3R7_9GAMM|nr:GPO family capsid scaffolding protein [Stenotrophomonas acidaminiphila]ALJ29722.1 phage capsid scaffolding protein [Stenotrophomonas acidaminiphila]
MSAKAAKKFRSKFFRIAVEGDTTDGRVIEKTWLQQMADSYNPTTYGARIWMEHIRSMLPDSPFRAYGDVTALKAEEVTIEGEKKLGLFAQIEPTDDLVKMVNVLKQKVFTSMEIDPKFAGTGKAYLTGLGVTDTPASLGTERLAFSAKHPEHKLFSERKQNPDNLFSAAQEVALEFEEVEVEESTAAKLFAMIATIAERFSGGPKPTEPAPAATGDLAEIGKALAQVCTHMAQQEERFTQLQRDYREHNTGLQALRAEFNTLQSQLDTSPAGNQPQRPASTGSNSANDKTDC